MKSWEEEVEDGVACARQQSSAVPIWRPSGSYADDVGGRALQAIADRSGVMIVPDRTSKHHGHRAFHPGDRP